MPISLTRTCCTARARLPPPQGTGYKGNTTKKTRRPFKDNYVARKVTKAEVEAEEKARPEGEARPAAAARAAGSACCCCDACTLLWCPTARAAAPLLLVLAEEVCACERGPSVC